MIDCFRQFYEATEQRKLDITDAIKSQKVICRKLFYYLTVFNEHFCVAKIFLKVPANLCSLLKSALSQNLSSTAAGWTWASFEKNKNVKCIG